MNRLAVLLSLTLLTACSEDELLTPERCYVDDPLPGIIVEVVDKSSGASVAEGARGAARDGAFIDSLYHFSATSLATVYVPPGTYAVEVAHDGYSPWTTAGVRVTLNSCGLVQPVMLRAELVAAP